jgi:uncharacterized protein YfcZ (UPF0381/DUF406 family)
VEEAGVKVTVQAAMQAVIEVAAATEAEAAAVADEVAALAKMATLSAVWMAA